MPISHIRHELLRTLRQGSEFTSPSSSCSHLFSHSLAVLRVRRTMPNLDIFVSAGLTAQNYAELASLYGKYAGRGLEILGFPCNQFGSQVTIMLWRFPFQQ